MHVWLSKVDLVMIQRHLRHMVNKSKNSSSGRPGRPEASSRSNFMNGDSPAGARVSIFLAPVRSF